MAEDIIQEQYDKLDETEKKKLYELYFKDDATSQELKHQIELLIFKERPPTGEEFLDPKNEWIPEKAISSIYPHVREDFLNIVDGGKDYFQLCFYGATRTGKTFTARLLIIYTIIFIHHLREPALYYNLSPLTDLCIYFVSWKFSKTFQLYLRPMFKILEASKKFVQVTFQDQVKKEQTKYGCKKIVFSKAATSGEITLSSGLQILVGNDDPNEILGADILQVYISEIAFFIEAAGASEDEIFRLYTDAYDRIEATVGRDFLTWIYLDSSANYADSIIENHIINKLQYDPDTYFRWRSRWEARPYKFPKWQSTGETFKVITGNGAIPAQLVEPGMDISHVPLDLIDNVPIDVKKQYTDALLKSIKDIGGKPTSNEAKLIQNKEYINNIFSNPYLINVLTNIKADSEDISEGLIFNQIRDLLFIKGLDGKYYFHRAPKELRYIGLDLSYAKGGDASGIAMIHKEYSFIKKETIFVTDFSFAILPRDKTINLGAIACFIYELMMIGHVNIRSVFVDTFQSEMLKQELEKKKIPVVKQSVDKFLDPYLFVVTLLANDLLKAGRNIYLKNNIFCLQKTKNESGVPKIDHPKGIVTHDYNGDWNSSTVGVNAKDVSDAVCQATWGAKNDNATVSTDYEKENMRSDTSNPEQMKQDFIDSAIKNIVFSKKAY